MNTILIAPAGSEGSRVQTPYGNYTVGSDLKVTVDSRCVKDLLGAGFTVYDDDLPAGEALKAGSHTVTSGEDTANSAAIDTGLSTIVSMQVMILRTNVALSSATITKSAGVITIADNSTDYVLTAGDVIHWVAVGTI